MSAQAPSERFPAKDYFVHHFGFAESVDAVREHISVVDSSDHLEIVSSANGRRFNIGQFHVRTPSSYEGKLGKPRGGGKLILIRGHGRLDINEIIVNMNHPDFNGATFQVASNFNCLEFGNYKQSASDGISGYASDCTQGPPCAAAAAGALLYRNYFLPHDGIIGQVDGDLNLLSKTPIRVVHGKAFLTEPDDFERIKGFDFSDENLYQVGVHENVEVTMTRDGMGWYKDSAPGTRVHQVFCSTLDIGGTARNGNESLGIVDHILKSVFKTTILAAWDHSIRYPGLPGSNKCVLTPIGGGSFSNPPNSIIMAVKSCQQLIVDSGLEVYFACFSDRDFSRFGSELLAMGLETHGKMIDCKKT